MDSIPGLSSVKSFLGLSSEEETLPKNWTEVGVVQKLYIYPVEGCHPKELTKGVCTSHGLAEIEDDARHTFLDRSFVVYSEVTKVCKTLQNYFPLVCLRMDSVAKETFNFHIIGDDVPRRYPLPDVKTAKKIKVIYHGKVIEVYDCGDQIARFISPYLLHQEKGVRLGMCCNFNRRDITDAMLENADLHFKTVAAKKMHADLSSYLIIAQPSIDDVLHNISNTSIATQNFRPNILLDGKQLTGYPEDKWEWIKINNVVFHKTRLCTHTDTITVNTSTGIDSFREEPIRNMNPNRLLSAILKTLQSDDVLVLGVNAEIHNTGTITVGDSVYVGSS